jgi:hypothetical protein
VKWYDFTKWLLERVDSFPKNQRFIFGTRLVDHALDIMETLVEASYSRQKVELLQRAKSDQREQQHWVSCRKPLKGHVCKICSPVWSEWVR